MKMISKFNFTFILLFLFIPAIIAADKSDNETTKEIVEEFDVNSSSNVFFKHRRGPLTVKYIDGNIGRVESVIKVKGDNLEDLETLLEAMSIDIEKTNGRIEIKTANRIVSWSNNSGFWGSRHKIVLSNGRVITSKVDDVTIEATLFLPKINRLGLDARYDDVLIEDYKADKLDLNIHSATLRSGDLLSDTHIEIKYGKLDIKNVQDLNLDSHDSKGRVGNIGKLVLKDKYSDFVFQNVDELNADLHDADIKFGSIKGDANITDKYSEVKLGNMQNGVWNLHDSKIEVQHVQKLDIRSKYSDIVILNADELELDCHDDDVNAQIVGILNMTHSKYTKVSIEKIDKQLILENSHDDDIEIDRSSNALELIKMNGKYTNLNLPLPAGVGYSIDAVMKYGDLKYPTKGLKESRYIKDGSDLEVQAKSADGSSAIEVSIRAHDCVVDLEG